MATTTFSGPVKVGQRDGVTAGIVLVRTLAIAVTAVASTALTISMPASYRLLRVTTRTTTAFTGNTVTAAVGTAAAGEQIVAATTIKAAGTFAHTLVAGSLGTMNAMTATTLHVTIAQTATETAVGAATMIFEYELL